MNNIYDVLEICLTELENGVELETLLARYPDMAAELRPMLQAADTSQQVAVSAPAQNVVMRNQAKVLQRFDQVWDAKPATRSWFPSLQRRAVAFALLMLVFFFSGTNLVRASFDALPGDSLYSVKRSWEKTTLFFTFNANTRENLEIQYEGERLKELDQLFASGRTAHVEFVGTVSQQRGEEWQVGTVSVIVSAQTDLPEQAIQIGDLVRVSGTTRGGGVVLAEHVELITTSTPIPANVETQSALETEAVTPQPANADSGSESETETPTSHEIETATPVANVTATPTSTPKVVSFEGILISMDQSIWKINDIFVESDKAEIKGIPVIGATVRAEGYFGANGIFVASKLEIISNGLNDNSVNSNGDDDNVNINGNTNTNTNGNNDDGSGGGGNGNNDNGGSSNGG